METAKQMSREAGNRRLREVKNPIVCDSCGQIIARPDHLLFLWLYAEALKEKDPARQCMSLYQLTGESGVDYPHCCSRNAQLQRLGLVDCAFGKHRGIYRINKKGLKVLKNWMKKGWNPKKEIEDNQRIRKQRLTEQE